MAANNGDHRNCEKKRPMMNRFARTGLEAFGFTFVAEFYTGTLEINSINQLKGIFGVPSFKSYSLTRAVKRSPYCIIGVIVKNRSRCN